MVPAGAQCKQVCDVKLTSLLVTSYLLRFLDTTVGFAFTSSPSY